MTFDPRRERAPLTESLAILLDQNPEQFPGAVGHAAMLAISIAVRAWLAGLRDQALPVIAQDREWLRQSLASDEQFSDTPLLSAARVADTLALATWLLGEGDDAAAYGDAQSRYQRYLESDEPRSDDAIEDLARLRLSGRDRRPSAHDVATAPSPHAVAIARRQVATHAQEWLDNGETLRLAAWLKLAYWDNHMTRTPDETLQQLCSILPTTLWSLGSPHY
jgi:hypothetical protein